MQPLFSYIIVNYHTPALTEACITSIQQHTQAADYEIIVVDNGSSPEVVRQLRKIKNIKLILSPENLGFGRANNLGAASAGGRFLFFVNSDAYLLNDAAAVLQAYLERHPLAAAAGCDLFTADGQKQVSYGNFPSLAGTFAQLGFYRLFPGYYRKHLAIGVRNEQQEPFVADYVSGAALFIRAAVFRQLGGFDPDFFLYFEETELAWRIRKAGYHTVLVPQAQLVHLEGGSDGSAGWSDAKLRQFTRSRKLYFRKTGGPLRAALVTGVLALQALLLFAVKRNPDHLKVFRILVQS